MDVAKMTDAELLAMAQLAESAERYEDMCKFMHALVGKKTKAKQSPNEKERNLLSVAYKNVVGSKRQSWRTLKSGSFQDLDPKTVEDYRKLVEDELKEVCTQVLDLLKDTISIVKDDDDASAEHKVFYLKMCGDYYRYLAEFAEEDKSNKDNAEKYYKEAFELAKEKLPETHPTRLGLALNFSVCYYEILRKKDEACSLAKEAFDAAIEKLDTLNDASYKDSTLIMQLLRDNLTLWTSENEEADDTAQ